MGCEKAKKVCDTLTDFYRNMAKLSCLLELLDGHFQANSVDPNLMQATEC